MHIFCIPANRGFDILLSVHCIDVLVYASWTASLAYASVFEVSFFKMSGLSASLFMLGYAAFLLTMFPIVNILSKWKCARDSQDERQNLVKAFSIHLVGAFFMTILPLTGFVLAKTQETQWLPLLALLPGPVHIWLGWYWRSCAVRFKQSFSKA